jgi:hypothetical protein
LLFSAGANTRASEQASWRTSNSGSAYIKLSSHCAAKPVFGGPETNVLSPGLSIGAIVVALAEKRL